MVVTELSINSLLSKRNEICQMLVKHGDKSRCMVVMLRWDCGHGIQIMTALPKQKASCLKNFFTKSCITDDLVYNAAFLMLSW